VGQFHFAGWVNLQLPVTPLLPAIADEYRKLVQKLGDVALREAGRARAQLRSLWGNEIRLHRSEDVDFLEAEVAMADERFVRLAAS
jgi:hypothetical protein